MDESSKIDQIQSVAVALQILELLANTDNELGVTGLAHSLGMTKSRIHRHLRSLVSMGYITQSQSTERYSPGARLVALGRAAAGKFNLERVAERHMRTLRDATGQAVSVGLIEPGGIRVLATLSGTMQIDVGVKPGSILEYSNSAQGKIALAALPRDEMLKLLRKPVVSPTKFTILDHDDLVAHIDKVRALGWATAANETMLGLNALACPILDASRSTIATLAIVSLVQHIQTPPSSDQIKAVQTAAAAISVELGYTK